MPEALVVDDDPIIRHTLLDALSDEGYRVRLAANGHEALEAMRDLRPDVVVLDLLMPVMDGWRFIETYRALAPDADVPIVTLSVNPGPPRSYGQLGVRAHVRKPFDLEDLLRTVQALVVPATGSGSS